MAIKVLPVSLATCCLASFLGETASAQSLSLRVDDGTVTLHATDVTVDEILAQWTKTTGLTVLSRNGHGSAIPVTLHLSGVTEREALGLVLRDLSGYIMGEKVDPRTGAVRIDRLVILPDSAAQAPDVVATPARRRVAPPGVPTTVAEDVPHELAPIVDARDDTTAR